MVETDSPRAAVERERLPREIWVLVGSSFMIAIGFGLVAPTLPVFVRTFDVSIVATSLIVSVFALARLVFAPSAGLLVGRMGELRVYMIGLLIVALSSAACAFATGYWQLLTYRSLGGIGSTMFTISALSLLIRLAPPRMRGRASGMWATGFLLGNIVGPLAGGGLVAISLRAPFLVYAAVLILVALVSGALLRGRTGVPTSVTAPDVPPARFRDAVGHRAYRAALVASFGNGWAVFGARIALVPLLVVEALGQPEAWSGIALAVFAVGNAATLVVAGRLADRYGRKPPMLVGLAVAALGTGALGYVGDPVWFLVVCLVAGLGSGLINPPLNAAVADVIGSKARGGTVLAGFQMASDTGAIVGPVAAGALAQVVGYGPAFAVTGGVLAVGWLFWLRAPETLPGPAPDTAPAALTAPEPTVANGTLRDL